MIKVKKRKILLLPGDGIGPEVIGEVRKIINWFNDKKSLDFEIDEDLAGGCSYDKHGSPITDENTPLYSGSRVKLAFYQQPYVLKDGVTYGTTLKLLAVQVVSLNTSAGADTGDMSATAAAEIFGTTEGFKAPDPNVTPNVAEDNDF